MIKESRKESQVEHRDKDGWSDKWPGGKDERGDKANGARSVTQRAAVGSSPKSATEIVVVWGAGSGQSPADKKTGSVFVCRLEKD